MPAHRLTRFDEAIEREPDNGFVVREGRHKLFGFFNWIGTFFAEAVCAVAIFIGIGRAQWAIGSAAWAAVPKVSAFAAVGSGKVDVWHG
jgi:hypothetical protein